MGITDVAKGCKDKAAALRAFARAPWPRALGDLLHGRRRERSGRDGDRRPGGGSRRCSAVLRCAQPHSSPRAAAATAPSANSWMPILACAAACWSARRRSKHCMRNSPITVCVHRRTGVKHVFLVPGGGAMHLNDSLARMRRASRSSATCTNRPARSRRKRTPRPPTTSAWRW